jgi:hypothetical protein
VAPCITPLGCYGHHVVPAGAANSDGRKASSGPACGPAQVRGRAAKNEGIEAKSHEGDRGDREAPASQGPRSGDLVAVEMGRRGV